MRFNTDALSISGSSRGLTIQRLLAHSAVAPRFMVVAPFARAHAVALGGFDQGFDFGGWTSPERNQNRVPAMLSFGMLLAWRCLKVKSRFLVGRLQAQTRMLQSCHVV
jgi:hypothetical protein